MNKKVHYNFGVGLHDYCDGLACFCVVIAVTTDPLVMMHPRMRKELSLMSIPDYLEKLIASQAGFSYVPVAGFASGKRASVFINGVNDI